MKKMTWIFAILLVAALVSGFTTIEKNDKEVKASKAECVLEDLATSGLGDVKHSILGEEQFQVVNGTEWILLSGQSKVEVESGIGEGNSSVFEYLDIAVNHNVDFLPNVGGGFLRAQNFANTEEDHKNPIPARLGEWQYDMFASHNHDIAVNTGWYGMSLVGASNVATPYGFQGSETTGGYETIPKNITVNVFVKVKLKCLDDVVITQVEETNARVGLIEATVASSQCDTCIDYAEGTLPEKHAKFTCFKGEIDLYETDQRNWSVSCVARTVGNTKKVLMQIGEPERTDEENEYLGHLDNQYPYYNVISTTLPYYKKTKK